MVGAELEGVERWERSAGVSLERIFLAWFNCSDLKKADSEARPRAAKRERLRLGMVRWRR